MLKMHHIYFLQCAVLNTVSAHEYAKPIKYFVIILKICSMKNNIPDSDLFFS